MHQQPVPRIRDQLRKPQPPHRKQNQPYPKNTTGKSIDEVIEMHQNAEQRLGQIQNEVGSLRGLVTDMSALQRPASEPKPVEQEPVNVSGDDILADPIKAVNAIVQPQLEAAQHQRDADTATALLNAEGNALLTEFPKLDNIVATPEFIEFASRTPMRKADFTTAAQATGLEQVRAARRLMEDFQDFQTVTAPTPKENLTPVDKARAVATESGGTGAPISSKDQIFESDVITLINSNPTKYRSPSFQKELMDAIKEGRYVKNA